MRKIVIIGVFFMIFLSCFSLFSYKLSDFFLFDITRYKANDFFHDEGVLELINYIKSGDIKKAKALLDQGVNIDATSDNGVTPLYYFFLTKNYPGFKRTLELGASPNVNPTGTGFYNLINFSMRINDDRYFKLLLQYNVNLEYEESVENGDKPLYSSLYSSVNIKYLKMLLEHGVSLEYNNWLHSPVTEALLNNEFLKVMMLIEYGADFINNKKIKNDLISSLESEDYASGKGSMTLKEQKQLVQYLKDKYDITINMKYPDGR